MAYISKVTTTDNNEYDIKSKVTAGLLYGQVDSTSTATAFTATVPGLTSLYDGAMVLLKNGVVTSAAGFTINVNGLGAKPAYSNLAAATAETTIFNINYTMLFIYDSTRVDGGGWICYRGYDANTNTIGYQLRTNSSTLPMSDITYRYRILFTSADGSKWVPANTSTSTNATASRAVNQRPINPFGPIVYYGTTASVAAGSNPAAANLWQQYTMTLGYSFNRTGAALVLTYPAYVYIKCAPQTDGSAIIDATTPYVQALPSTNDGKIYILLGRAYSATAIEMLAEHPVFYHDGTALRLWTGAASSGGSTVSVTQVQTSGTEIARISVDGDSTSLYAPGDDIFYAEYQVTPYSDVLAAYNAGKYIFFVRSGGTAKYKVIIPLTTYENNTFFFIYAGRADANMSYVSRYQLSGSGWTSLENQLQAKLTSGTNIKTINGESLLGSGDLTVGGSVSYTVTSATLTVAGWSNNAQTVSVSAVTASSDVIVAAAPASISDYASAGIYCSAQAAGSLTFTCTTAPTSAITVNLMIFEGGRRAYRITNNSSVVIVPSDAVEGSTVTVTATVVSNAIAVELDGEDIGILRLSGETVTFIMPSRDVTITTMSKGTPTPPD